MFDIHDDRPILFDIIYESHLKAVVVRVAVQSVTCVASDDVSEVRMTTYRIKLRIYRITKFISTNRQLREVRCNEYIEPFLRYSPSKIIFII